MLNAIIVVTSVAQIILSLFVLLRGRKNVSYLLFFFLGITTLGWALSNYLAISFLNSPNIITIVRLILFFVVLQNACFYLFARTFPDRKLYSGRWLGPYGIFTVIAAAATLSPYVFTSVSVVDGLPNTVAGPAILIFVAHAGFSIISAFRSLVVKLKHSSGLQKKQLQILLLGSFLLWVIVPITNFVITPLLKTTLFIVLGPIYTLVFASIIAYAIVTQHLFDIRAVIARTLAYILVLVTVGAVYIAAGFGLSNLLFSHAGVGLAEQAIYGLLSLVLVFTFQPLRVFFERITDSFFYRDSYDSQEVLNQLGKILISEFTLDRLLPLTLSKICRDIHISSAQFYIFDNDRIYRVENYGSVPSKLITVPNLTKLRRNLLVADELGVGHEKQLMDEYGFRVVMRLRTREAFVGYLMLGDKQSGDLYSSQDLDLLQIIIQELAVAISNAKAYEEISQFNITLQQRVEDATERLRAANNHLKELDEAKDEFISMASHQLRTPLTSIKGYLSMLIEGDAGPMDKTQKEFVDYAYGSSERMVSLISDLLNVSRMSAGKFVLDSRPCDLKVIVADEVRQLQGHAEAKGLRLDFSAPRTKLPMISIDEDKTRQVIMNLIDNALYYTKQGKVVVTLGEVAGALELRVTDSGIGVPKAERAKLFHKFYRADNAQKVRPDGTGLGLFLAKRVVEDQGGTILFESTEGKGSTFGFRLPLGASVMKGKHES